MKSEFSTAWQSSSQTRKQRKYIHNAPIHLRHKFLSAHLSKELRNKYGKRSLPLRKGDEVLIMRGNLSGKKGKVAAVNVKYSTVTIEGQQRTKKDGSKINIPFSPSVLQIQNLILDDKRRTEILTRKATVASIKPKTESKKTEAKKTDKAKEK